MPTKTLTQVERVWSVPVRVENVPEDGAHFDLIADDKTRAAITTVTSLQTLRRLVGAFDVTPHGRGLHVVGEVSATVGQNCVVTLEPVENEIRETVDLVFVPGPRAPQPGADSDAMESELDAKEPPEELVDGKVDLGALAIEFLMLGIDPYPRKPGVAFEAPSLGEAPSNPFAALAKLKEKQDPDSK